MKKKLILKYILLYLPMMVGIGLFSYGVVNLFSSLLLFIGGYIAIKNTFDYREVRKNINSVNREIIDIPKEDYTYLEEPKNIVEVKRVKRNIRVRKRVKE